MGTNSIHCNLCKDDIIADIKMTLGADYKHEKGIILVEGKDDITFFNGKFLSDVEIYESFSGKQGVKEIVEFFSEKRVVGICDKDYETQPSNEFIFFYDFSCLEMMLVHNKNAYEPFFYNFYFGTESPDDILIKIFENLKWVSIFRKLNHINAWGFSFKGIPFCECCEGTKHSLSIPKILEYLNRINKNSILENRECLTVVTNECKNSFSLEEFFDITQGHDFIHYFQKLAQESSPNSRGINKDVLFNSLCASFRIEDFYTTNLYISLKDYYNTSKIKLVS